LADRVFAFVVDAVEFFEAFQTEFSIDLREFDENWSSYFASEGVSPVVAAAIFLPTLFLGIMFSHLWPALPTWVAWLSGISISFAGFYAWYFIQRRPTEREIAIVQLVDAAETGRLRLNHPIQEIATASPER